MKETDQLVQFADEVVEVKSALASWRILVVDDDGEVHQATRYALEGAHLLGRAVTLIHAYSAAEAEQLLHQMPDITVVLLDVVMESDDSGLCLIDVIRDQLGYRCLRIILRTGQPGNAPETTLVARYDIHDYMLKTDVSHERLLTSLTTAVRTYQQLANMALMEQQMTSVVRAVDRCLELHSPESFAQFYCQQLIQIYQLSPSLAVFGSLNSSPPLDARIVATDEAYHAWLGMSLAQINSDQALSQYLQDAMQAYAVSYPDCLFLKSKDYCLLVLLSDVTLDHQVLVESWQVFDALMGVCFKHVC